MACYDFQDGRCTRGDRCRFSHGEGGGRRTERGGGRDDYQRGGRDNFRDDYRQSDRRSDMRDRGRSNERYSGGDTGGVKVGKVRRLNEKGFGFIDYDTKSIFFHASGMKQGTFDDLREGDEVEFEAVSDDRTGKDRAENIRML
jgi:cold shock CspA family protein